ncbi:hypothetical protein ACE6H2_028203 [Prunus campanulata]
MQSVSCRNSMACRSLEAKLCTLVSTSLEKVSEERKFLLLAVEIQAWNSLLTSATTMPCHQSWLEAREMFGKSTFELAVLLLKWLPIWLADKLLLLFSWLILGSIEKYGLNRPSVGPMELKNMEGKTPVLDIGALDKIKSGGIKVVPGIKRFSSGQVELVNGERLDIDSVVLATGYRSNVPSWLQEGDFFSNNGFPKQRFPHGWKGNAGLYAVGFTRRGLSGASSDATRIAQDIGKVWKGETKQIKKRTTACHRRCISQF